MTLWMDEAFRWVQVFTADALPEPRRRRGVAVEPMTCPPDAFNSGEDLLVLAPGETWRGSWGISPLG
jgi:aldose 1-epimerase